MRRAHALLSTAWILALLVPALASAQDREWFFVVEAGVAEIDFEGWDSGGQLQGSIGYPLTSGGWGSIAGELAGGVTVDEGSADFPFADGKWRVTTVGFFTTYRAGWRLYPLARVGLQGTDITAQSGASAGPVFDASVSNRDAGLAFGAGLGLRLTRQFALETAWTRTSVDRDVDVITIGVRY